MFGMPCHVKIHPSGNLFNRSIKGLLVRCNQNIFFKDRTKKKPESQQHLELKLSENDRPTLPNEREEARPKLVLKAICSLKHRSKIKATHIIEVETKNQTNC